MKLTFSEDAAVSFGEPVTVGDGNPAGRVETLLLDDGGAMVCWLEKLSGGGASGAMANSIRPSRSRLLGRRVQAGSRRWFVPATS